ncbi:MAG: hypothetical protein AB1714_24715 [Acidobacteriota bacterium]
MAPVFDRADEEAAAMGWSLMGNLVSGVSPKTLMRVYSRPAGPAALVMYFTPFGPAGRDLFTAFEDGFSLTSTTTLGFQEDDPGKKILRRRVRDAALDRLHAIHEEGVQMHEVVNSTRASPTPRSLDARARVIDAFLDRSGPV